MFSAIFIKRPVLATVLSLILVLLGAVSLVQLPIDYYPEVSPPTVSVTSNYGGANAEVVEAAVTNIIEREINGVEGMRYLSSVSTADGTSQITVTFNQGRDLDDAAIEVQNRVARVESQLPEQVVQTGVTVAKSGGASFVQFISIASDTYDIGFVSNYVDLYVRDALRRIPGISDVQIFGERRFAMRIWIDPTQLAARQLTTQDVVNAIRSQNIQVAAGAIGAPPLNQDQDYQLSVRTQGRLTEPEAFGNIVLTTNDSGAVVRLKDVARVELGAQDYNTSFQTNGTDSVGIGITKLATANSLSLAQAVRDTMADLAESFPPGLDYQIPYDTTLFINQSIWEVVFTLLQAIAMVVVVIYIFLMDVRTTLIPAITIPVSLIGTFVFMQVMGFSINALTMFGLTLATGLVVDDAIVVVENVATKLEKGLPPAQAALEAMREIFGAVIATTLVLVAVFVPVAFFPGTSGQIYRQFALTIVFSVCISTFNAVTLSPALSALLLRPQGHKNAFFRRVDRGLEWCRERYQGLLNGLVRLRYLIVWLFVAMLGATYWLFQIVPTGFLPAEDQGYFINIVQGPPGTSLSYTQAVMDKAAAIIQARPEVRDVFTVGGFSFAGASPNNGLIFVTLQPWSERTRPDQSAGAIVGQLFGPLFGGINEALVIPIEPPAIQGLGNSTGFQFQLQDRSLNDFNLLEETGSSLFGASQGVPALQLNPPTFSAGTPQLLVDVDRDQAQLLGVEPSDVFGTLQTALGGTYVNNFDTFNRNYRVIVQADPAFRDRPEVIGQYYVRSQTTGAMVPLSTVATVQPITGPAIINHYNLFRSSLLEGTPAPGFSSGQALEAMSQLATQILPQGMGFEWTGISLEEIESGGQAAVVFLIGLAFVYLALAGQYESYVDPFIILLSVPLAIFGALAFQIARGLQNDVFCQVGLVMLIGLASKNSILIVEFANQLRAEGMPLVKAAVEAAQSRFRAILMTAFSFILGILPLLLAKGPGAGSRQSLGTAVFGGMFVSTLLSLLVVPVLFILIRGIEDWARSRLTGNQTELSLASESPQDESL